MMSVRCSRLVTQTVGYQESHNKWGRRVLFHDREFSDSNYYVCIRIVLSVQLRTTENTQIYMSLLESSTRTTPARSFQPTTSRPIQTVIFKMKYILVIHN